MAPSSTGRAGPQSWWAELPGAGNVKLLQGSDFQTFIDGQESVLVMFYAPWCGFCKDLKPIFADAALKLHDQKIPGIMAAVDASEEKSLASKYKIASLPTLQYFSRGKFVAEYERTKRTVKDLVDFMKTPPTTRKEEL